MKKYLKWLGYLYLYGLLLFLGYHYLAYKRLALPIVEFIHPQQECFSGNGFRYCVHKANNQDDSVYLYAFHGKDQNENFWVNGEFYAALVQKEWQLNNARVPKVISISLGSLWLITPKLSDPRTGLVDKFKNEIFPTIENQIGTPKKRFLLGASMGGINALSLTLSESGFFERVAALCPPLYEISPFSSFSQIFDFMVQSGAKPKPMSTALGVGRVLVKSEDEWNQFSPLAVLKTRERLDPFPALYLSCGLYDEFGNFPAVERFAEIAKSKGATVFWRPNTGDHCAVDAQSLANFLKLQNSDAS